MSDTSDRAIVTALNRSFREHLLLHLGRVVVTRDVMEELHEIEIKHLIHTVSKAKTDEELGEWGVVKTMGEEWFWAIYYYQPNSPTITYTQAKVHNDEKRVLVIGKAIPVSEIGV